jgi:hypothetical protein
MYLPLEFFIYICMNLCIDSSPVAGELGTTNFRPTFYHFYYIRTSVFKMMIYIYLLNQKLKWNDYLYLHVRLWFDANPDLLQSLTRNVPFFIRWLGRNYGTVIPEACSAERALASERQCSL